MFLKACLILVNVSVLKTQSTLPLKIPICMVDVCYIKLESTNERNWTEAQKICQSSERISTTLPIVDSLRHQKSFEAAARLLTTDNERKLGIWIGAKASYSNPKNWTWLDGNSYPETVMQSEEGFGKNYAFVQDTSTGVGLRAYAADPKDRNSYICFYSTAGEGKTDNSTCMCKSGAGRTLLSIEPRCYVKYDGQLSWFHARNDCLTNGGDLASFTNISILDGQIGSNKSWVALRSSQWNWQDAVTGSSSDVTFTLWFSDQPNDTTHSCISTDAGDKFPNWRDYNCSEPLPFICQFTPPYALTSTPEIYATPSSTPKHTASSSLRSSTIGSNSATTPSVSSTIPLVSSNGDRQNNDSGSVDTIALAVGLGVGVGVPVILALLVVVIVISVRRKRRNSNAGGNPKSRKTAVSNNSHKTQENNRMEMSETQNGQHHYDNFSASQYATIPASAAAGPKLDAPSTQGTVYADLSFNQAGPS